MAGAVAGSNTNLEALGKGGPFGASGFTWSLFELGRNPYYNLVVIFIFSTYLSSVVVGGGTKGQETLGMISTWSGVFAAMTAPFLGAIADRGGQRKPILAVSIGLLAICSTLLWWVKPGDEGLGVAAAFVLLIIAYVTYTYAEVMHNAMLPDAARPSAIPFVSGNALAMGNFASIIMLVFMLWAFSLPGQVDWGFIPKEPLFGINQAEFEHARMVGPVCAVMMIIFVTPMFFFVPDRKKDGVNWGDAVTEGVKELVDTIVEVRQYKETLKFLIARMFYADGISVLLMLGAVYVVWLFDWQTYEIMAYGIIGLMSGFFGGIAGGFFDKWLGPRNSLIMDIVMILLTLVFMMSVTPDALLFGLIPAGDPVVPGPFFNTLAELTYLCVMALSGIFIVAAISSSRVMLVRLTPRADMQGKLFGLYAVSGTVTVWMGPLLVTIFTALTGSNRWGMSSVAIMFLLGLIGLFTIKVPKGADTLAE